MLASIGGKNTKQIVFNILSHIFADSVAKNINWKGMNNEKKNQWDGNQGHYGS